MSTPVTFTVYGKSETKGSTSSFISNRTGRIVTKNDNPNAAGWALRIGIEASIAMRGRALFDEAVAVNILFYLQAPKKPKSRQHITKPDLDKLIRCALDALTSVVWSDDARVVDAIVGKRYAAGAFDPLGALGRPRAEVVVQAAAEGRP